MIPIKIFYFLLKLNYLNCKMLIDWIRTIGSTMGAGGLFDFNATLPFLAIQFLILMFVLNTILYNPLLSVINDRNEYKNIE